MTEISTITGTPTSSTTTKTIVTTSADGTTTTTTETTIVHYGEAGSEAVVEADGCAIKAVDLLGMWVDAGAPEMDLFDYISVDDEACSGDF